MKKIIILPLAVIIILILVAQYNNNPKNIILRLINQGEIHQGALRYRIYLFGILPIGEATIEVPREEEWNGNKVYHLSATAESLKLFSRFFRGAAALESLVDKNSLNPIIFKQKLSITDKKDVNKEVFYNQAQRIMSIEGVQRQISPNTQDPLSAILNIQRKDFDKTEEFELSLNTNQKNYVLKGIAKTSSLTIKGRTFKTSLLDAQISRRDKNPYHKSSIRMVLLNEKVNIPILIRVFASGVVINARLIEIK